MVAGAAVAKHPHLKALNGRSPGRDSGGRKIPDAPAFVRDAPEPPKWLSREAKAEWGRIVPELNRMRLLKLPTRGSMVAYCEAWSQFVAATKILQAEGLIMEGRGTVLAHPAVAIQHKAGKEMRAWAVEYGLTPASETRIKPPKEEDGGDSDFD